MCSVVPSLLPSKGVLAASHRMNPRRRSTFLAWRLVPLHILWHCLSVALIHCLQRVWLIPPKPILELIFSIICYTGISGRTCNLLAENGATVMLMLPHTSHRETIQSSRFPYCREGLLFELMLINVCKMTYLETVTNPLCHASGVGLELHEITELFCSSL